MKWISDYQKIIKSGSMFFFSSGIVSVLAYAFHIFAARLLSVSDYGTLQTMLSLQNIGLIPIVILVAFLTRIFAEHNKDGHEQKSGMMRMMLWRYTLFPGSMIFVLLFFTTPFLQSFFGIGSFMLFGLLWLTIYLAIFQGIDNSLLNGWHKFFESNLGTTANGVSKFIMGVLFMTFGWGVVGGFLGITVGFLMHVLVNAYSASSHFSHFFGVQRKSEKQITTQKMGSLFFSSYPVILGVVAITIFSNIDVLIVKHHFNAVDVGQYGGIFVLSKMIFFAVSSLASVVIPLVTAEKRMSKKHSYLIMILCANCVIAGVGVGIFYFFPEMIINVLFGKEYLAIAPYLAKFGMIALLLSVLNIFIQYFISLKCKGILIFIASTAFMEIALLWVYGMTFDLVFMIIFGMLLVPNGVSLLYFLWDNRMNK